MFADLDHLYRFPTRAAIDALALRFNLPNTKNMQDWEYEVADADRIAEFLAAYDNGELSEDEKFTLMATLLQSSCDAIDEDEKFMCSENLKQCLDLLERDIHIHIHLAWYWSSTDTNDMSDAWSITPFIRPILLRHQGTFARLGLPV
ncbi:MAG: hypothetical protein HY254_10875 [Burkholderiales bacterium]|nr:hypothetical protein [Burkholderiales bacterium]